MQDLLEAWAALIARHTRDPDAVDDRPRSAGGLGAAPPPLPLRGAPARHTLAASRNSPDVADDADAVRLAAWYHDCGLQRSARRRGTQRRSAPSRTCPAWVSPRTLVDEVARLVRMTVTHDPAPGDRNGEVLSDADLAALALPREGYRRNSDAIRAEYAHIPDEVFRKGRTSGPVGAPRGPGGVPHRRRAAALGGHRTAQSAGRIGRSLQLTRQAAAEAKRPFGPCVGASGWHDVAHGDRTGSDIGSRRQRGVEPAVQRRAGPAGDLLRRPVGDLPGQLRRAERHRAVPHRRGHQAVHHGDEREGALRGRRPHRRRGLERDRPRHRPDAQQRRGDPRGRAGRADALGADREAALRAGHPDRDQCAALPVRPGAAARRLPG